MTDFVALLKSLMACPDTGKWLDKRTGEHLSEEQKASIARMSDHNS